MVAAMINSEVWLAIKDYEGAYEVSNMGRVRSIPRTSSTGRKLKGKILSLMDNGHGYKTVMLSWKGAQKRKYVHRLVLEAFTGPCPEGFEARHFNGVRSDNRLENLEWSTHIDNVADRKIHGTELAGERNSLAVLTESEVVEIREIYATRLFTQKQLAEEYGITQPGIGLIVRGVVWADSPGPITKAGLGMYPRRKSKRATK